MSPPNGLTVHGFLADGHGAGVGGLQVELWSANGHGPSLVAASQSDDAGLFRFRLAPERLTDKRHGRSVEVEFRVLDGRKLILSEVRELSVDGRPETIELSIPPPLTARDGASDAPEIPNPYDVARQVQASVPDRA